MPRPKLHSDEAILDAALAVLLQKGPSAFTLSDVAASVGISRAALIQRFKDKATLHHRIMERLTQEVRDFFESADPAPGLDPLWSMLQDLIAGMGSGEGMEGYLLLMWGDVQDPALRALAIERNTLVREAIKVRLPETPHSPGLTASLVQSIIQGSCMQWLVERQGNLSTIMTEQTRQILQKMYPRHRFE